MIYTDNQKIFSHEEFNQIVTQVIVSKLKPSELDSIGVVDSHLEILLVDPVGWQKEIEAVHLEILQEKINNYIHFLEASSMWHDTVISLTKKSFISHSSILHLIMA